jgi:hypothetical protein
MSYFVRRQKEGVMRNRWLAVLTTGAFLLAIYPFGLRATPGGQPRSPAAQPPAGKLTPENIGKVQKGLADAEVVKLLGPADRVWNYSADNGIEMSWGNANQIRIVFDNDRAVELSGRFPDRGQVGEVTLDNFKRLKRSMTLAEVEKVLGKAGVLQPAAGVKIGTWAGGGEGAAINVQFADGKVTGFSSAARK